MPSAEKAAAVAEIAENFTSSSAAVITEYRGLSVKQITQLRRTLGRQTTYAIVKNTLTKRAAADAGVAIDDSLLVGPTAIAFVSGDPVEATKGLRDFSRTNPALVIKGGILDGKLLSAAEMARIADLDSREVLLAKLAGAIKALPARAAGLFQAPLTQMALLAKALEERKAADAPAAQAAPAAEVEAPTAQTAPAADSPAEAAPQAEATSAEVEGAGVADAAAADAASEVPAEAAPASDAAQPSSDETPAEPAE